MTWLIAGGVVVLVYWLVRNKFRPTTTRVIKLAGDGYFEYDIVGEAQYQDALKEIAGESADGVEHYCLARIEPEPTNRFDRNAIRVDISGKVVGYIPRDETADFHTVLKGRPAMVHALVTGGWRRKTSSGNYGVKLDVEFPLKVE